MDINDKKTHNQGFVQTSLNESARVGEAISSLPFCHLQHPVNFTWKHIAFPCTVTHPLPSPSRPLLLSASPLTSQILHPQEESQLCGASAQLCK